MDPHFDCLSATKKKFILAPRLFICSSLRRFILAPPRPRLFIRNNEVGAIRVESGVERPTTSDGAGAEPDQSGAKYSGIKKEEED